MSDTATPPSSRSPMGSARGGPSWRSWCAVFAAAALLFALTARRGAQWQDSGLLILRAMTGDLYGSLGLALAHPVHHWLARVAGAIEFLEPAFAVTLISALAGAIAVANTYGCIVTLTGNPRAACYGAASLAVAHMFWQSATLVETYALAAALFSAECWCLAAYAVKGRRGALMAALGFNGVGVANHLLALLTTPILFGVALHATWKRRAPLSVAVGGLGLWLVGSLPYTVLIVMTAVRTGSPTGALHSALFGESFADEVLSIALNARDLAAMCGFAILNFPSAVIPLAAYGLVRAGRVGVARLWIRAMFMGLLVHVMFAVRFDVVDQHTFLILAYVIAALTAGVGYAAVEQGSTHRSPIRVVATALLVVTPVLYAFAPNAARRFGVLQGVERNKPYRDDYVYVFTPWSVADRSADVMSRHALELAGDAGMIVVEDPMAVFAVRYRALRERRPGIHITEEPSDALIEAAVQAGRPVVLVPLDRDAPDVSPPAGLGRWKRIGDLYVLQEAGAPES